MRAFAPTRLLLRPGPITVLTTLAVLIGLVGLVGLVAVGTQAAAPARPVRPPASRAESPRASEPPTGPGKSRSRRRVTATPAPAGWTGFAFDACRAPSQSTMDRWRVHSPFLGVGVYIGGTLRACPQGHLTRRWVARQLRSGWRLLPLWVGPQAACTGFRRRIDAHPGARGRYPAAGSQGIVAGHGAAAAAHALGIPAGTTLWYDIEPFSTRGTRCRRSALRFLSSWTLALHRRGYQSGVYSTLDAVVAALAHAPARGPAGYASPEHVWFAWANHRADSWLGRDRLGGPGWKVHRRVHQYALDVSARYGGVRLQIDSSFVDLGGSVRDARTPGPCGHAADLRWYPDLAAGATGPRVETAQCLLRFAGVDEAVAEPGFGPVTGQAVRSFQRSRRLPATGRTDARTWTALLATGSRPVVKRGVVGAPVRRVQRALNAALPGSIAVTGVFDASTASAVRHYQQRVGTAATGVVNAATWDALAHGRLTRPSRAHKAAPPTHRGKAHRRAHHRPPPWHRRHHRSGGHHHRHGHPQRQRQRHRQRHWQRHWAPHRSHHRGR